MEKSGDTILVLFFPKFPLISRPYLHRADKSIPCVQCNVEKQQLFIEIYFKAEAAW